VSEFRTHEAGMADAAGNRNGAHDPEGRVRWLAEENAVGQADFIAGLFGLAAEPDSILTLTCVRLNSRAELRKKTLSWIALRITFAAKIRRRSEREQSVQGAEQLHRITIRAFRKSADKEPSMVLLRGHRIGAPAFGPPITYLVFRSGCACSAALRHRP
jgi:hypothetical protein